MDLKFTEKQIVLSSVVTYQKPDVRMVLRNEVCKHTIICLTQIICTVNVIKN